MIERRDGEPGLAFRALNWGMFASSALRGWSRVWLMRRERCACQQYTCPYTQGRGVHVTPYQP